MSGGTNHVVTLPLIKRFDRPVISLYNVNALIDPGSVFLIVNMDDRTIRELFGGVYTGQEWELKGVGTRKAKIYMFKHFCIGDMIFRDFPAAVTTLDDKGTPIVVGSSMYSRGTVYTVDTESDQITFNFPEVFFRAGKPCIRRDDGNGWGFLDCSEGVMRALPIQ